MYTKRELLAFLKDFDEDIRIEVGEENAESGTQHDVIDVVYVTGEGRCQTGESAVLLLFKKERIEPEDEEEIDDFKLKCPNCGEEF